MENTVERTTWQKIKWWLNFITTIIMNSIIVILVLIGFLFLAYYIDVTKNVNSGHWQPPLYEAYVIVSPSMVPTIKVQDAILIKRTDDLKVGDICTYFSRNPKYPGKMITHRIVGTNIDSTGNKVYIFDPDKLKNGLVSYKLVYTIPSNIKIVNIGTPYGADIYFYSDDDHKYRVKDTNIDNDIKDEYSMFDKATYEEFGDYSFKKENYTVSRYKQKVDYDIICNMFYVKDNVLYELVEEYYHYQEKKWVPFKIEKVEGNYEGEKILDIYNDRIVRTDKGFYEIVKYYDKDGNIKTTTLKMELPSKYYDEVLTFTYEYVILNDYTLIPINDIVTKRKKEYKYNYYVDKFEETLEEFVE